MKARCCHETTQTDFPADPRPAKLRRARSAAGWVIPSALLALMPKCPLCLAAYFALFSGVTLSYSSAHILMRAITALCIGTLALCVARRVLHFRQNKLTFNLQSTQTN